MATAEGLVMEHREEVVVVDEDATEEEEEAAAAEVLDRRNASTIDDINWILCLM